MNVYELAQLHLRESHANDHTSLCLARALVSRERIPLIIDSHGLITTSMNAMSIAQRGEYHWYAVAPSLLNVSYAIDSADVIHWCDLYPSECQFIGMSYEGQAWDCNVAGHSFRPLYLLTSLLAASLLISSMKQAS